MWYKLHLDKKNLFCKIKHRVNRHFLTGKTKIYLLCPEIKPEHYVLSITIRQKNILFYGIKHRITRHFRKGKTKIYAIYCKSKLKGYVISITWDKKCYAIKLNIELLCIFLKVKLKYMRYSLKASNLCNINPS